MEDWIQVGEGDVKVRLGVYGGEESRRRSNRKSEN